MSNDGTDHPAVIAHGSLSPQVGPAAHFAAGETRSATGPVPDILENPLLPLILSSHPHAGKKVRISTGVHRGAYVNRVTNLVSFARAV